VTPRKDSDFYKLKTPIEKVMYLQGMPKQFIKGAAKELDFINFRGNLKTITTAQQRKAYEDLKNLGWGSSNTAFWLASPHDRPALEACCQLIRHHALQNGFKSFQFVSPIDPIPKEEDRTDLYVLLGANEKDIELTNLIRRWLRYPHGSSVWVVGVANDPYGWITKEIGVVPDFMFWFKKTGMHVG
jgi:hypothetical protein